MNEQLMGALVGLTRAAEGNEYLLTEDTHALIRESLWAAGRQIDAAPYLERILAEKKRLVPGCFACADSCGRTEDYDLKQMMHRDLKESLMQILTERPEAISTDILYKAIYAIGMDDWGEEEIRPILEKLA